jgi:hypothetical protein
MDAPAKREVDEKMKNSQGASKTVMMDISYLLVGVDQVFGVLANQF